MRLVLGGLMLFHAFISGKLTGAVTVTTFAATLARRGLEPALPLAYIVFFTETIGAVCLILGSYYALALSLVHLNYGLLIGVISGIITFVPYIGSMTGFVIGVSVAIKKTRISRLICASTLDGVNRVVSTGVILISS